MARPTTKTDLEKQAQANFDKLWQLIDKMSETAMNTPFDFPDNATHKQAHWQRDKNVRDVLVHLYEWHQLFLHWVDANQAGKPTPFLPEPYNWKTTAEMNVGFCQKHQNTAYDDAVTLLKQSHADVMQCIAAFSHEELFTRKHFNWTGTTSLGSYCVSATSSHYDWAMKKLRKHQKMCS